MTVVVDFSFPWGRYHATPWAHAANEAIPEWPPSPWRILRTFYASWRGRCAHIADGVVEPLLEALSTPPQFLLPSAAPGHTRHYYPSGKGKTDLTFDPFMAFEHDAIVSAVWDVPLDDDAISALREITAAVSYLGRQESLCDATVATAVESANRLLCEPATSSGRLSQTVRLLSADAPFETASLTVRAEDLRAQRRLDPPGTRWVSYTSPVDHVFSDPVFPVLKDSPTTVRWRIDAPALPSVQAAVTMAEALRQASLSKVGDVAGDLASPTLSGRTNGKEKRLDHHAHAHYYATDEDKDGLIDHLTLWSRTPLNDQEVQALTSIRSLGGRKFISDFRAVRVLLTAMGADGTALGPLAGPASVWLSHTPFAPTQNPKRGQTLEDFLAQQIALELERRQLEAQVTSVQLVDPKTGGSWLAFRRRRGRQHPEQNRRAYGCEFRLDRPLNGPISLGQLSHFGLGLFLPAD